MESFFIILGVLQAGLSAADPPEGLYIAQGVTYVGCFEAHNEQVLNVHINADCTFNSDESCLTPPTCIGSCQSSSASYIYIGLKYPGQCFCDSTLRGVNQTDSVNGSTQCDARCPGDLQFACGNSYNMLIYRVWNSGIIPQTTTHVGMPTSNSASYKTESGKTETTPKRTSENPQSTNTAIIAGAAAGGATVLIAGSVVTVCLWRKKSGRRRGDKRNHPLALQDVNSHTSHTPSGPNTNPDTPPNPSNIDALYAKPDKKRKQKKSSPDDPSYQDVVPTGAQYATVNDDYPPNTMVQRDSNPYDSIQTDPQYAVVKKGPRYRPNVDVNPIYISGTDQAKVSSDSNVMVDNAIYE